MIRSASVTLETRARPGKRPPIVVDFARDLRFLLGRFLLGARASIPLSV
jgi:hypothetical protein